MKKDPKLFYYTWASYSDPTQPAYHLDVVEKAETMEEVQQMGGVMQLERQMNVADAEAAGFDLSTMRTLIDVDMLERLDKAKADADEAARQNGLAQGELTARAEKAEAAAKQSEADRLSLSAQLDTAKTLVEQLQAELGQVKAVVGKAEGDAETAAAAFRSRIKGLEEQVSQAQQLAAQVKPIDEAGI